MSAETVVKSVVLRIICGIAMREEGYTQRRRSLLDVKTMTLVLFYAILLTFLNTSWRTLKVSIVHLPSTYMRLVGTLKATIHT